MNAIKIIAKNKELNAEVNLPLSKSISNRALMISAISKGVVKYDQLSDADDTVLLQQLLEQIDTGEDNKLNMANAGTVYRFLIAYLSTLPGKWIIEADERMYKRPIIDLLISLNSLGADMNYHEDYPDHPSEINGKPLEGGEVKAITTLSSQFVSALMMIAPGLPKGMQIEAYGHPNSLPYIHMTRIMMQRAGAEIDFDLPIINIKGTGYKEIELQSEYDWSAAVFWYQTLALSEGGQILLKGLKEESIQGDKVVARYFFMLGIETEYTPEGVMISKTDYLDSHINFDLGHCPDLAPAMIVTAAALGLTGLFLGLGSLKGKESDRLQALSAELEKAGIVCNINNGMLSFPPQKMKITEAVNTHNDHRIAMAFAPLALLGEPVTINNPEVVSKSYPEYWKELKKVLRVEF